MDWQSVVVGIIAVVVVVVIIRKAWRLFSCRDESKCMGCNKECSMKEERSKIKDQR